ncbi:MAG: tetratricopeptide repeat protein [Reyranella sp.]|uniref:GSCFA domain-containing protein n=1 Tax=Reyranella sp. TaxID=1929291 RepID=UPI00121F8A43|nr:GSCFA domain-containing protein [Reyranella sp.]TAJ92890.1 MAG: tetratricopeptide repeat protein [Reyranella sp.]
MPIRRISAADAYGTLRANPDSNWPRRDDPANRFAHFADPSFKPRFTLEPGQRIFTIGSCFARGIERTLADRGFDIPTLALKVDKTGWSGDPTTILNNYVPPAIAPQIRWAFGLEEFDIDRHAIEVAPGRYIDPQLTLGFRPVAAEALVGRRNDISAIYRNLASSHVVLITLGLIEAWFDNRSGLYINCPPPKGIVRTDPSRFELHVLDYADVTRSLADLVDLLDRVCPPGHRIILTVSPVPLQATFTSSDVAVANAYSKAVLRAAVEPFVADRAHIEYFPSYESVVLTDRSIAFVDDQVHIQTSMVRFNVDRMINRYVETGDDTIANVIARAREDGAAGRFQAGLKRLQQAWTSHPGNPDLAIALARAHLRAGNGAAAESLLLALLETHESVPGRTLLARHYNESGRHEEAALQAEKACEHGKAMLDPSLQRVEAYYHLGRFEEGFVVLDRIRWPLERKSLLLHWKARYCERLGRLEDAEAFLRECNGLVENALYMAAFAEFLAKQDRWPEAAEWVDRALLHDPNEKTGLRLRAEIRKARLPSRQAGVATADAATPLERAARWSTALIRRAVGKA